MTGVSRRDSSDALLRGCRQNAAVKAYEIMLAHQHLRTHHPDDTHLHARTKVLDDIRGPVLAVGRRCSGPKVQSSPCPIGEQWDAWLSICE